MKKRTPSPTELHLREVIGRVVGEQGEVPYGEPGDEWLARPNPDEAHLCVEYLTTSLARVIAPEVDLWRSIADDLAAAIEPFDFAAAPRPSDRAVRAIKAHLQRRRDALARYREATN